jgi:hypothetical protein
VDVPATPTSSRLNSGDERGVEFLPLSAICRNICSAARVDSLCYVSPTRDLFGCRYPVHSDSGPCWLSDYHPSNQKCYPPNIYMILCGVVIGVHTKSRH